MSFDLVLEHIEDLRPVLREAARVLRPGGRVLISELHPFKQYAGSQARCTDGDGVEQRVPAFTHHARPYGVAPSHCVAGDLCCESEAAYIRIREFRFPFVAQCNPY